MYDIVDRCPRKYGMYHNSYRSSYLPRPNHQGIASGPLDVNLSSLCCSTSPYPCPFPHRPFNLLTASLPIPQVAPATTVPKIPVGASTNPAPDTNVPKTPAPTVATRDPMATYFAYRTTRQKMNIRLERSTRRKARVRRELTPCAVFGS